MKKALSYRLFGLGRVPRKWRPLIEQEGILVADEGMPGWFIAKDGVMVISGVRRRPGGVAYPVD